MVQSRYGQKTGVFYHHLVVLHDIQERADELVVGDGDDVVQILLNIRENLGSRSLHCGTVGDGADRRQGGHLLILQRNLHTVGACGLHADNLDIRIQKLCQSRHAGGKSAASDGHQNVVHQRQLLYNLHGNSSLAGGYRQIIEGMDKGIAVLLRQLIRILTRLIIHVAVKHDLSAIALGTLHLHQRRGGRHHNDRFYAVGLGRVSHALGVISGGCGNQSLGALFVA